ncbi:hypothetical protein PGTUg99_005852 [Puccinia graminis f. sp. tritici]|nr:hypothetical protein PGTUg99_005852 [Puccinia graminis f. sp. tritici]
MDARPPFQLEPAEVKTGLVGTRRDKTIINPSWEDDLEERHPLVVFSDKVPQRTDNSQDPYQASLFEKLIKTSPLLKSLSPRERSTIIKNWEGNKENVISLCVASKKLWELHLKMEKLCAWFETVTSREVFSSAKKLLEQSKKHIFVIKQARLLELGQVDSYPILRLIEEPVGLFNQQGTVNLPGQQSKSLDSFHPDILRMIAGKFWQEYGQSMWREMKALSIKYASQFQGFLTSSDPAFLWNVPARIYLFQTLNLLFKNGFINREAVRGSFHDPVLIKEVIYYAISGFKDEYKSKDDFLGDYLSITKHPYWPLLNESFNVLGRQEERMINISFLAEKIYFYSNVNGFNTFPGWEELSKSFQSQEYIIGLESNLSSSSPTNQRRNIHSNLDAPKELKDDVKCLLKLVQKSHPTTSLPFSHIHNILDGSSLYFLIHAYFDLIESNYFPGLVKEACGRMFVNYEEFERQQKLIVSYLKASESLAMTQSLADLIATNQEFKTLYITEESCDKIVLILEKFNQQASQDHSEFKETYHKIVTTDESLEWFNKQGKMCDFLEEGSDQLWSLREFQKNFVENSVQLRTERNSKRLKLIN